MTGRNGRPAVLGIGLLLVTLWSAAGLAVGAPSETPVDLAAWRGPSYAKDLGSVSPVSLALAEELTGLSLLAESTERVGALGGGEEIEPLPIETPTVPGELARPVLRISMSATPRRVRVGDQIDYLVVVQNVGNATALDAGLDSQVAPNTTFGEVECLSFLPAPTHQCVSVPPYPPPFPLHLAVGSLKPGESASWPFTVTVVSYPTSHPEGYIINSSTASAENHPTIPSNLVRTRVDPP